MMKPSSRFKSDVEPIWCPGCGDFQVLSALYSALEELEVEPHRVVLVSGIGCSSRLPHYVNTYSFHTVHGRSLPVAMGVKMANPELQVIVVGGDGDLLAIGGGHFFHAARRNPDLPVLLLDNGIYGQTKGQFSPTTPVGEETASTPYGNVEPPVSPIAQALVHGATFVAQAVASPAYQRQLTDLILRAIRHRGFALLHILVSCVTFSKARTYRYYQSLLKEMPPDHDPSDLASALRLALSGEGLYQGVLYQVDRPTFEDRMASVQGQALRKGRTDLKALLSSFG